MLMNSDFVTRQARYFAQRLQKEIPGDVPAQVGRAWKLAFSESAAPDEVTAAVQFLQQQAQQFEKQVASSKKKKKTDPAAEKKKHELAALASFCHALLSSNQFLYVE
jgi:hypothetical protein